MNTSLTTKSIVPLVLAGLLAVFAMPVHAEGDHSDAPRIHFRHKPHMERVEGTHVSVVRQDERPAEYDVFNYKSHYYVHNDAGWYHSKSLNGRYKQVNEEKVPTEFRKVPREHWGHYPSNWSDQKNTDDKPGHDSQHH